jgi:Secretion system C-terminal sorting domain
LQGIGNRTVRLKLVVDDNFNPDYSMSKIYSDESVLAKTNVKQIDLNGSALITSYELFQNYPNPFNPSTTIKYQIPKSGNVSLKVYDILGSEIATPVNEFKNEGRYEVIFDASILSSGVYIYRLNVNESVIVKKMVLLK